MAVVWQSTGRNFLVYLEGTLYLLLEKKRDIMTLLLEKAASLTPVSKPYTLPTPHKVSEEGSYAYSLRVGMGLTPTNSR